MNAARFAPLFAPLALPRGRPLANRFALAPMTNQQSAEDGTLEDDELEWLAARAHGGFGLIVSCASHVAEDGKGFPGQLGCFADRHVPGLARLAAALRTAGAVSAVQLYHGGRRAVGASRVSPSEDPETGARAMTASDVEQVIGGFVSAAQRVERAGFDGAQLHAAHGYLISQFLSPEHNRRRDDWGGTPAKRARFLLEILQRIRAATGPKFQLGVRLSPERFGQDLGEVRELVAGLLERAQVDYVDLSLWDVAKVPEDPRFRGRTLLGWFTDLPRGGVRLGAAGRIWQPEEALATLDAGVDFVVLGKVAVVHHDYPRRLCTDPAFTADRLPVSGWRLAHERLGPRFVRYLSTWTNFVADVNAPAGTPRFDIDEYLRKGTSGKC